MMYKRVVIDCEYNDFQGEIMSMALVAETGEEFYEVVEFQGQPTDWVAQNVVPILGKQAIPFGEFQDALGVWLRGLGATHIDLLADWPDDIKYFCEALVKPYGERVQTPNITMQFVPSLSSSGSAVPHNALEDARAIMQLARAPQNE